MSCSKYNIDYNTTANYKLTLTYDGNTVDPNAITEAAFKIRLAVASTDANALVKSLANNGLEVINNELYLKMIPADFTNLKIGTGYRGAVYFKRATDLNYIKSNHGSAVDINIVAPAIETP